MDITNRDISKLHDTAAVVISSNNMHTGRLVERLIIEAHIGTVFVICKNGRDHETTQGHLTDRGMLKRVSFVLMAGDFTESAGLNAGVARIFRERAFALRHQQSVVPRVPTHVLFASPLAKLGIHHIAAMHRASGSLDRASIVGTTFVGIEHGDEKTLEGATYRHPRQEALLVPLSTFEELGFAFDESTEQTGGKADFDFVIAANVLRRVPCQMLDLRVPLAIGYMGHTATRERREWKALQSTYNDWAARLNNGSGEKNSLVTLMNEWNII